MSRIEELITLDNMMHLTLIVCVCVCVKRKAPGFQTEYIGNVC